MSLTRLKYEKTWMNKKDFPTYEDSEEQVRADLQYHPDAIKQYLNETVAPAVDGLETRQEQTRQELDRHQQAIHNLETGGIPDEIRAVRVDFAADDWSDTQEPTLQIEYTNHKRENENFGYNLWELVGSETRNATWHTAGTDVNWDSQNRAVILRAESAYAGSIVFFGV